MRLNKEDWQNMVKEAEMQLKQSLIMTQINQYILKRAKCRIKTMSKEEGKNTKSVSS